MKTKNIIITITISVVSSIVSVIAFSYIAQNNSHSYSDSQGDIPVNYANFFNDKYSGSGQIDFTAAANASIPAVVHIKTKSKEKIVSNNLPNRRQPSNPFGNDFFGDFFDNFFNGPERKRVIPEQIASGSGVLISEDGYIVTNNHVVENADEITITLDNKKTYEAEVIGTDPNSDLAVIKIDEKGLPFLIYGNSDDVEIGQWVLAVGYPLFLEATVTAGIVSAKSRSIGVNRSAGARYPIESFIQTDAAVNKGNSGGALVNTKGELIGINSAIASVTGYYTGYSYAIPVNLAKKIINDIIKFGDVKRAFLGIQYLDEKSPQFEEEVKKHEGFKQGDGVIVVGVAKDGAAKSAGIKEGDIIVSIDGKKTSNGTILLETIAQYRPDEEIEITYLRNGKTKKVKTKLNNFPGVYNSAKLEALGVEFEDITAEQKEKYGVSNGVLIKNIDPKGQFVKRTRIKPGFVILKINDKPVENASDVTQIISNANSIVTFEGIYPKYDGTYFYDIDLRNLEKKEEAF